MTKNRFFNVLLLTIVSTTLFACSVNGPQTGANAVRPALENIDREQIEAIAADLPTRAGLAEVTDAIAENQEAIAEIQVTVGAVVETVSELEAADVQQNAEQIVVTVEAVADTAQQVVVETVPTAQTAADSVDSVDPVVVQATVAVETVTEVVITDVVVTDVDSLKAKLANAAPDENGAVTVTITQDEINKVLQASGQSNVNLPISNVVLLLTGGNVIFEADITQPATGRLQVIFRPYVVNGVLQFEVIEASMNGRRVPAATVQAAEATLNATLGNAMNSLPANVVLVDVIVGEGYMTIYGQVQ